MGEGFVLCALRRTNKMRDGVGTVPYAKIGRYTVGVDAHIDPKPTWCKVRRTKVRRWMEMPPLTQGRLMGVLSFSACKRASFLV